MKEIDNRKTTRQLIWQEIEDWKKNPPNGFSWHIELNNFSTYLPNSEDFDKGGRLLTRWVHDTELMDTKNIISHSKEEAANIGLRSKLYLNQTLREFFATIDQVIYSLTEVDLDHILYLQDQRHALEYQIAYRQNMSKEVEERMEEIQRKSAELRNQLYDYCLPIYVELRVMGYSHFDLTG